MHPAANETGLLLTLAVLGGSALASAFAIFPNPSVVFGESRCQHHFPILADDSRESGTAMSALNEENEESKLVSGWGDDNRGDVKDDVGNNEQDQTGEAADDPLFDEYCSVMDDFGCEAYEDMAKNLDEKVYRWIRVEAQADETISGITSREDVMLKIQQVKESQSAYGPSQLYPRKWEDKTNSQSTFPSSPNGDTSTASFSVLQFNALAEGLSSKPKAKTPFPVSNENQGSESGAKKDPGYGGFTQVSSPEICLDFNLRRWRLLEVILGISYINKEVDNSNFEGLFDILALEEIDRFRGFFTPLLRIFGYKGIFMPKSKAPGVALGYYSDGCALFWKTNTFELIWEERISYKLGNQIMILAELKHKRSGYHVVVAVTHLKAQKSETNEKIRRRQVEELLGHIQTTIANYQISDIPVLIMGDFNADPPSRLNFPDSSIRRVLSNHLIKDESQKEPMRFMSAYEIDPPKDDFFTTWKTRGTQTVIRIIDYIFHSEKVMCTATLGVPKQDELEASKLPGLRYPSDHLMVAAKFVLAGDDKRAG